MYSELTTFGIAWLSASTYFNIMQRLDGRMNNMEVNKWIYSNNYKTNQEAIKYKNKIKNLEFF